MWILTWDWWLNIVEYILHGQIITLPIINKIQASKVSNIYKHNFERIVWVWMVTRPMPKVESDYSISMGESFYLVSKNNTIIKLYLSLKN